MTESAPLAALRQTPSAEAAAHQVPFELAYRGKGRRWLAWSALAGFVLGFTGHQWWLTPAQNAMIAAPVSPAESVPATLMPDNLLVAPGSRVPASDQPTGTVVVAAESASEEIAAVPPAADQRPSPVSESSPAGTELTTLAQLQLALLQRNASAALERDRLLTPAHDNAVFYYRAMLDIAPDNAQALEGLRAVAERYVALATRLQIRGDAAGARQMLANAEQVWPGLAAPGAPGVDATSNEVLVARVEAGGRKERPATEAAPEQSGPSRAPVNIETAVAPAAGSVTRSHSSAQEALEVRAARLAQNNDFQGVIDLLAPELSAKGLTQALAVRLHAAYLAQNDLAAAMRVRTQQPMPAHTAARLYANEKVQQGDFAAAIAKLETDPPALAQAPDYFSLLAGLYYQTGRYRDSQLLFTELLKQDSGNGRWWLGFAVSVDAQNNPAALTAFERAQRTLASGDQAQSYIAERIAALSPAQGGQL